MFVVPFLDPLPPGPIDHSRDWVYRLGVAVGNLGKAVNNIGGGGSTGTFSFADNVPLVMSNTTSAELVFRSVPNNLTLANGAVDLLAINVSTKLATFAGAVVVASGGLTVTGASTINGSLTATGDIHTGVNFTTNDTQGIIFNSNTSGNSFIRHNAGQMQFFTPSGLGFALNDSTGFQISGRIATGGVTAGTAAALPALPAGYLECWSLQISQVIQIPFYN